MNMTEQKVNELPLPADPDYLIWLRKEDFQLETTVPVQTDTLVWTRPAKYGSPKCSTNGQIIIEIVKDGDTFGMNIRASTPKYWTSLAMYDISEADLVKFGRQYEHRMVDAWRELSA